MGRFVAGMLTGLVLCVVVVAVVLGQALQGGAVPPPRTPTPAPKGPANLGAGQTWLGTVDLTSGRLVSPEGGLDAVRARGSDVRLGPTGLSAGSLGVTAMLPYATAARQIGDGVRLYPSGGGRVGISRVVSLLGRRVSVRATGDVRAEDGQLALRPEQLTLGGGTFLDAGLSALARRLVTIHQPVAGLPEGLALRRVQALPSGFRVHLSGTDVRIAAAGIGAQQP